MADRIDIRTVINLPPEDTVRAFEARDTLRTTVGWREMNGQEHARQFTVAKVAKLDLLADIEAAVADVIANGGTVAEFQANLIPTLQKAGWWGEVTDPALTGTTDTVNITPHRLRTIYDTNLRVSRAAGRWKRIQALKATRPFLRYTAVLDARTRPAHRAWHGTILPVDDPWWDTHYPPCGWYCRCSVNQLSQRDLDTKGWKVTPTPPEGPPQLFLRPGSSVPEQVPSGIAPGFAYNAGKASMAAVAEKATRSLERIAPADLATARATLDEIVQSDAFLEALKEPGNNIPVMVLAPDLRAAIGADNAVVVFSSANYGKQIGLIPGNKGHPELTIAEYRLLPKIGASPDLVLQQDDRRLLLFRASDNRWLVATIKSVADRQEMYLLSYRFADARDLRRLKARYPEVNYGN